MPPTLSHQPRRRAGRIGLPSNDNLAILSHPGLGEIALKLTLSLQKALTLARQSLGLLLQNRGIACIGEAFGNSVHYLLKLTLTLQVVIKQANT